MARRDPGPAHRRQRRSPRPLRVCENTPLCMYGAVWAALRTVVVLMDPMYRGLSISRARPESALSRSGACILAGTPSPGVDARPTRGLFLP